MSEQQDDFDLEVSALEPAPDTAGDPTLRTETPARADTTAPTRPLQHVSLVAAYPLSIRLLRAGSLLALLLILVSAVLFVPTENRTALLAALTPPTPSPTPVRQAGDDLFLWEHSVPWGQLVIDGKPGPDVSRSPVGSSEKPLPQGVAFRLGRGRHMLQYLANHFPTLRCSVSVPAAPTDSCPLEGGPDSSFVHTNYPATRVLDLQATIDRLSLVDLDTLLEATQARLTVLANALPAGTLMVDDHYLDAYGQVRQITAGSATLSVATQFHLVSNSETYEGGLCVTLCTRTGLIDIYDTQGWALLAPVEVTWSYATPDGQVAAQSLSSGVPGVERGVLIPILATIPTGAWQIDAPLSDVRVSDPALCGTGEHYRLVVDATQGQPPDGGPVFQWTYAASTPELGCLLAGSQRDLGTGKPFGPIALTLYRAGVLMAVNATAHQIYPTLPTASAHERALAAAVTPSALD